MKTKTITRMALGVSVALLGLIAPVFMTSGASAAPVGGSGVYNCTGGDVAPGTYWSMIITGVCYMPAGNVVIRGDLTVAPKALLDAVTPGDPTTGKPVVPATVVVGGNVFVGSGAVLLLGCSPNISCSNPPGITFDRIGGSLFANGAQGVVVHSASIRGSVYLRGGGGGAAAETCAAQVPKKPVMASLKPWSEDPNLDQTPVYSDFEDTSIGGNLAIAGLTSCWLGSLRDQVRGNASFSGNTMGDPDAMEIDNNVIGGNMTCWSNTPAVQFGDGAAAPNIVGRNGIGECGFNVVLPNPAPEADQGKGVPEHIAVSTWSLGTYYGTHTSTNVTSLPAVTTESGDTIVADLNDFALTGTGLTGSGTYNSSKPPGSSGEALLETVYPNGSKSFIAYDNCKCSLAGKTGTATLRFYGTSSANGWTYGTFLITSGGAGNGRLSTLAGWGTFWSQPGGTWRLVEHLRIT